ncbi:inositol phosphorylceramide synthase [Nocardioides marmoriginsengisoli]|uniref:Inositol phosphorylceramide synthase n=2 Tax=Nocardioides marmoriginsengisoli TaxID=661483 RepID=A0A3N0CI45_9ACTN|nr:inositol phosphorylceramide synthase [Nocardioides marmoriginsengisoli]
MFGGACALALAVATWVVSYVQDLPIRDPDGVVVPAYIQIPAILGLAWLLDVLPRAIGRSRTDWSGFRDRFAEVVQERWNRRHTVFALTGLATWYVSYAAFRNLKSYVPFVNEHIWDERLERIDHALWFGNDPANVLHSIFGTSWAAEFFSFIYVSWIVLVPVSIAIALIFTRAPAAGSWYVTAISLCWGLGAVGYFSLPTLGPAYSYPADFTDLKRTYTEQLVDNLLRDRMLVVPGVPPFGGPGGDPHGTNVLQTIAAFPSLHVGIMVTISLFLTLIVAPKAARIVSWTYLGLTIVATIYFGWHFSLDALGGFVLGALAVYLAALGTGNHVNGIPKLIERGTRKDFDGDEDQLSEDASRLA